jgi:hypothetical protein
MRNKLLVAVGVVALLFALIAVLANTNTTVELQQLDTKTKEQKIQVLQSQVEANEQELLKAKGDTQKLKEIEQRNDELQKQVEALQAKKAEEKRIASEKARNVVYAAALPSGGSCADWIAGAGINDMANAAELIRRESGCNPHAMNSSSGACGIAQELPCGKSGCQLGDGACQVKWMNTYVTGRYGSWAAAVAFHNANNWY